MGWFSQANNCTTYLSVTGLTVISFKATSICRA